jgi:3'-5' exoribonuclease
MSRKFLKDCEPGDLLEDVFVLSGKQLSTTQTGKHFIKCTIGDRTKQITARMWNASQGIFNAMPDGGFLRVAGRVENYQDNLQFIIDRFWLVEDEAREVVIGDLMPQTKKDVEQMFARMLEIVRGVKNTQLLALVEAYIADATLMEQFKRSPAAMTFHHAFIGGLLEHTLNMLEVAERICPLYPNLNGDLVKVGIFLHDIAKTWELTYRAAFNYSDGGHLIGHVVKSAIWIEHKAQAAGQSLGRPLAPELINALQHIVLSHHGLPEFGAARLPSSPEAILVHLIDNIDAKMTMSLDATRGEGSAGDGAFTDFQKALGVKLYRPDTAPPDR